MTKVNRAIMSTQNNSLELSMVNLYSLVIPLSWEVNGPTEGLEDDITVFFFIKKSF